MISLTKKQVEALRIAIDIVTDKSSEVGVFTELWGNLVTADRELESWLKRRNYGHPDWCGKPCSECQTSCGLDKSMPCSPDCEGLDPVTGEPSLSSLCDGCDCLLSMCYASIVFLQGDEAEVKEAFEILDKKGEEGLLDYLLQWDYGDAPIETMKRIPWGLKDSLFKKGSYVVSYNVGLGYVGLTVLLGRVEELEIK